MAKNLTEKLLKKKNRLVSDFMDNKASAFMDRHVRILDDYFHDNFETSTIGPCLGMAKNPYAVIALGGYGREEQSIHSDIDLLFLFQKKVPKEAENLVQEMIYPLWDIGLDVSPATRSLKECINLAAMDFDILTPLLDARFICGMSPLYSTLMEQLHQKIISGRSHKIINWLVKKNQERHTHFGDSSYLLEPNLKEGQGGLRDYHTLLWIARIQSNIRQCRDLEYYGYLSHDEFRNISKALAFIWNVRNRLHQITGRKCDQLHLEYQKTLAHALKFKELDGREPVELFLGALHGWMAFIKQQHLLFLYELNNTDKVKPWKKAIRATKVKGLEVKRGMIYYSSSEELLKSPDLLIKIFEESSRLKIPLSAEARRLVKEFGYLVDDDFRASNPIVKSFERILATLAPTFNVLNEMLSTGFLVRFIPEFNGIVNRIQYTEYHLYPVDLHLLRTVRTIKNFGTPEDPTDDSLCGNLYQELKSPKLLLWAALLHDIGKVESAEGHSKRGAGIVRAILVKRGFSHKDIETISFLVEAHLLLVKTATRRDINDEETAIFCARTIKATERLKMLYLLSVADSIATGPMAWSEWTAILVRDLFLKIYNILEKGELATHKAMKTVEKKKARVLSSTLTPYLRQDFPALFNVMPPRYMLYTRAQDILKHVELYKSLKSDEVVWQVTKTSDSTIRNVTICAQDCPGLFSKIAGVFTLNSIDILDAQIYTWRNNVALDIFKVKPPPDPLFEDERWSRAKKHLKSAINGKLDLGVAIKERVAANRSFKPYMRQKPDQIVVDNDTSDFFTIIEVFTNDFPGLLFRVTDALYRCGLDIRIAKIATNVDQVVDIFYVRDLDGQKVDLPDQVSTIKSAITEILPLHNVKEAF